eukprot:Opistho-2@68993
MAIPAKFADLGKEAKDLFSKDYHFGDVKLELKSTTANGVEFVTGGTKNNKSGAIFGNLESKYKYGAHGITFTERWNTKNVLNTEVTVEDSIAKGLRLNLETSFAPNTGDKAAKVSAGFKQEHFHTTADFDVFNGPVISGNAVVSFEGILAGYEASYNVDSGAVAKSTFALGYKGPDFTLHSNIDSGKVSGSIFHRASSNVLAGAQFAWARGTSETTFAIGGHYTVDKDTFVKAKVDNKAQLGLSYTQVLRKGVKVTLSALVDGKNLNTDSHKLGLSLVLEP